MDDTQNTSRQAREDTLVAMAVAGMLPGIESRDHSDLADCDAEMLLHEIPRELTVLGMRGGAVFMERVSKALPPDGYGKMALMFSGYADDPRPAFAIPELIDWCRGVLSHRLCLEVLLDERRLGLDPETAVRIPGGIWVVAHAYGGLVFQRSGGDWLRDIGTNLRLYEQIRGAHRGVA